MTDALDSSRFGSINSFRKRRGRLLMRQIAELAAARERKLTVLDVGGRSDYWQNLSVENIGKIVVLNAEADELQPDGAGGVFESRLGDACDLTEYDENDFDLAHSNSVIEHVGSWEKMEAMAREMMRVGRSGWVQTPAWEFPVEPHFRAPFLHWFGQPLRRKLLVMSPFYRHLSVAEKRWHVDRINLLSQAEMCALFPGCEMYVERLLFAKSYVARW